MKQSTCIPEAIKADALNVLNELYEKQDTLTDVQHGRYCQIADSLVDLYKMSVDEIFAKKPESSLLDFVSSKGLYANQDNAIYMSGISYYREYDM